jgi:Na+-transporting NADH:ubiquinone oxidoreductase subunit NqrC
MVSVQTVLLVVVLALFCLVIVAGVGVFLFYLLKSVRDLQKSLNDTAEILKLLTEGTRITDVLIAFRQAGLSANELGRRTDQLTAMLKMIHQAIFNKGVADIPGVPASAAPSATDSAFFPSSDEANARNEAVREMRRRGIVVGEEAHQPEEAEGVTSAEPE